MEKNLRETDRARSIFELAVAQPRLDTPELLWKDKELYERLLDKTKHLKVWISYADFEASAGSSNGCEKSRNEQVQRSRAVFQRTFDYFRNSASELQEEVSILLKEWLDKEISFGDVGDVNLVQSKTLSKVTRKRPIPPKEHSSARFDKLTDGLVADEVGVAPGLVADEVGMTPSIIKAAYEWKRRKSGGFDTSV
uniref:Uncharacterized protein n=1 Tax=Oryza meridionalis TaxID=40149 RepID=A0A0E0DEK7_9ORYZ